MNGITINDKQYIFLETDKSVDCDKCDFHKEEICKASIICTHFYYVIHGGEYGCGVFKELKEEK